MKEVQFHKFEHYSLWVCINSILLLNRVYITCFVSNCPSTRNWIDPLSHCWNFHVNCHRNLLFCEV